jgi:MFS family permease
VFIGGPLLAGILVAVASPAAALVTGIALAATGSLAFASSPASRAWRGELRHGGVLGPLVAPGMRTLLLAALPLGYAFGSLEVALPAFGISEGSGSLGGYAIAAMSVGSAAGGIAYGALAPGNVLRAYLVFVAALPFGVALLALPWSPLSMLLLAPLAGAAIAPLTAAENEVIGGVAPAGTLTEAYTWIITATVLGISAGVAVSGAIVEAADWRAAVAAGAAVALLGGAAALARRDTLVAQA